MPLRGTAQLARSGGHASRVRQNAALTSFAAWFGFALRAAEPGCFTCHGGRQAFGSPPPAQVSAALGRQGEIGMRVFISWSGARSKRLAFHLHQWLGAVVQRAEPWMSDRDLEAGQRWNEEISAKLKDTHFGIICLTRENSPHRGCCSRQEL